MRVLILGASGIIGQHMRLCVPPGVVSIFSRRRRDPLHESCDLTDEAARTALLERRRPQLVINLAGENSTDAAQRDPAGTRLINSEVPLRLAAWCRASGAHYLHVSTQAVFSGTAPPYTPYSPCQPVNEYGRQRLEAEGAVRQSGAQWTIVRPTFVLGIRPLPHEGRQNPVEAMLAGAQPRQVSDRWFSPLFARDAAELLWEIALRRPASQTVHLGNPVRVSRWELAQRLGVEAEPCAHDSFAGLAPRPLDTTYAPGSCWHRTLEAGLVQCRRDWEAQTALEVSERAREMALFLGRREDGCFARLSRGFHPAHAEVAADFRAAGPQDDAALLDWYRNTEAYLWELSAYHSDPGFNYLGMCRGIAERLAAASARRVLCLGDGIGDLTLTLRAAGLDAVYHDLAGSRTAAFAEFRAWMRTGRPMPEHLTAGWAPEIVSERPYDAIVSLDFLEHVTEVPAWCRAIHEALAPGGLFMAQNAFGAGSGPGGSIPMHLERNDRFERDWDPMLAELGFRQESGNWYRSMRPGVAIDWNGAPPFGRRRTLTAALNLLAARRMQEQVIVEVGTAEAFCPDGLSNALLAFAWYAGTMGARVHSVDIREGAVANSASFLRQFVPEHAGRVTFHRMDAFELARLWKEPRIDLIYYDAPSEPGVWYTELHKYWAHCFGTGALVLFDDTFTTPPFPGKGSHLVPWLLANGWQQVEVDCEPVFPMVLLEKK